MYKTSFNMHFDPIHGFDISFYDRSIMALFSTDQEAPDVQGKNIVNAKRLVIIGDSGEATKLPVYVGLPHNECKEEMAVLTKREAFSLAYTLTIYTHTIDGGEQMLEQVIGKFYPTCQVVTYDHREDAWYQLDLHLDSIANNYDS